MDVFLLGSSPLFVTQTLGIWEPCLAQAEAGLLGALTRLRVNALGFLSSPSLPNSPQWVPFVLLKSLQSPLPKASRSKRNSTPEHSTQRLGLIAGFVWAQMCSSLERGGAFFLPLESNRLAPCSRAGRRRGGGTATWIPAQSTTPDFELVWCALGV